MPRPSRKEAKPAAESVEERPAGRNESGGLLNTIDKSLDDMRTIITCRVCVRPLYEPFTIECGHTFCYVCLRSWLEKNAGNRTCPDCRAKITREPAPAYLIREMTQLFSNRPELLPAGETTKEHQDQQQEEAKVLEEDRNGRGLFGGCFKHRGRHAVFGGQVIIDDEDGVNRCPRCAWEVEDGECAGCGWPGEAESSDNGSVISLMSLDGDLIHQRVMDDLESTVGEEISMSDMEALAETLGESDGVDNSEDDSVGSLNEFVVHDGAGRAALHRPRLTGRQLERRFPRRGLMARETTVSTDTSATTDHSHGVLRLLISESESEGGSSSNASSAEGSDAEESSQRSHSPESAVDYVRNVSNRRSSDTIRANAPVVHISDDDDDDTIHFHPRIRLRPNAARRPTHPTGVNAIRSRSPHMNILEVSSDSDGPIAPSRAHRRRRILNSSPDTARSVDNRIRLRPTTVMHDTDTEEDADVSNADSGRGAARQQNDENDPSLIEIRDSDDASAARGEDTVTRLNVGQVRNPRSRLDPTTSIPVRRENVNMPGAFPPSFISEPGQSQSTPSQNFQDLTAPPTARAKSSTRQTSQSSGPESNFLDRRHHEERLHPHPGGEPQRRDRSAAKSARRQDRQRMKAGQEARDRRNGEPSAPPSTSS